jgi:hypothetical protein
LQANGERGKRTIPRTPLPNWFSALKYGRIRDNAEARLFGAQLASIQIAEQARTAATFRPKTKAFENSFYATLGFRAENNCVAGNGFRAIGVITALEEGLGRPVLVANQVAFGMRWPSRGACARERIWPSVRDAEVEG